MNKGRFESFSDGVFAFAITLLILGIVLPAMSHPSERELRSALFSLWPNFIAFALSFAVIGIMWQNHHALFRFVGKIDRKTVGWNLVLLAGTVVIPFATSTLGMYPTMHASAFFYGLVLTWCSTAYNLMLVHLIRSDAFEVLVTPERVRRTVTAYRVGWATYAGATLLALVLPLLSFAAYILIAFYYFIPRGVDADA
ncbi:MAG TPA: TMEM175 family protein [Candidatus Acidoferrum sp.]|nr:TMEM175 family protein [Candidatus Acidoferrum sp.]